MKTKIVSITVLLIVVLFVLAACSSEKPQATVEPPKVNLLKRADASKFILDHLDLSEDRAVDVRLMRPLLNPNSSVESIGSKERYSNSKYNWFFVIDEAPGAVFPHPVKYGFLDYETETIDLVYRNNLPTINGRPLWEDLSAYQDTDDIIFSKAREGSFETTFTLPGLSKGYRDETAPTDFECRKPDAESKSAIRQYALLLGNRSHGFSDTFYTENLEAMAKAIKACGYEVPEYLADGHSEVRNPYIDVSKDTGYGLYQIRHFINKHKDRSDADEEILIYLTGDFGVEKTSRGDKAYLKIDFPYGGEDGKRTAKRRLYARDLADILSTLRSDHVNIVIDGSHSGGFVRTLATLPRVETVIASCEIDEYVYSNLLEGADNGKIEDPYRRIHGELGTEFTSGFAKGLTEAAKAWKGDTIPIESIMTTGYRAAIESDISAIAGATHPVVVSKTSEDDS